MNDVSALRASVAAVPDDAELKAKLTVATNHVHSIAEGLTVVLTMADSRDMDTTPYCEQVLSATGQITTEVLEVCVITNLMMDWRQRLWGLVIEDSPDLIYKVARRFITPH